MGHRYQKGALNWTLIFLYIMYLSMIFAKNMTEISAFFWYRKVVWLMDYIILSSLEMETCY